MDRLSHLCLLLAFTASFGAAQVDKDTPAREKYRQAELLMRQGSWSGAVVLLQEVVQEIPNNPLLLNALGVALSSSGRRTDAEAAFQQALQLNPRYESALKNLSLSLLAGDSPKEAQPYLERLKETDRGAPFAHVGLAELAFGEARFADAARHFALAGDLVLQDPAVLVRYARALAESGQPAKAEAALLRVPASASPDVHYQAGLHLAMLGAFDAAASALERSRGAIADPSEIGFNLVLAHSKSGNHNRALEVGEELIGDGHGTAELRNLLSQSYESIGDTKRAYDSLREAIEMEPSDESNYVDLIALCLERENFDLGLEIADIAIDRLPDSHRMHLQRGVALAMKGRFPEAEGAFDRSADLAPENNLPGVALGLILMQQDRLPEAVRVLRSRKDVAGDDYLVHWFLAEALQRSGLTPGSPAEREAVEALQRSIDLRPDLFQSRLLMGKMLARQGRLEEAIGHLEKARVIDPGDVSATYQLALTHRRRGDAGRARELLALVSQQKAEEREEFAKRSLLRIVREESP